MFGAKTKGKDICPTFYYKVRNILYRWGASYSHHSSSYGIQADIDYTIAVLFYVKYHFESIDVTYIVMLAKTPPPKKQLSRL